MYSFDVYKLSGGPSAKIRPLDSRRSWMDVGAYNCFPIVLANTIGYGLYFEEDISFILNPEIGYMGGSAYSTNKSNFIWSGESLTKNAFGRGLGTVSFETNLIFKSDNNLSLLTMPVPNETIDGMTVISTLLSTSFFSSTLPVVCRLSKPNFEYFIPAGTNVAALIPIQLGEYQDFKINFYKNKRFPDESIHSRKTYLDKMKSGREKNVHLKMYQKGIDENDIKIGSHEVNRLNLIVNNIEES
jgi:hypothetical protein